MTATQTNPWALLETPRLHLTLFNPLLPQDYTNILQMYNIPSIVALWGNAGNNHPSDLDASAGKRTIPAALCTKLPPNKSPPTHPWVLACLKDSGEFIGHVGLFCVHEKPEWPVCIGWHFRPEMQGQGYATEATGAVLRFADEVLGVQVVVANVSVNNAASCRVAEKCGGVVSGREMGGGWERKDSEGTRVYEWRFGEKVEEG